MDFDRNKNGDNLFEGKGETKEDKIDRLKKYDEYWNFEKNYHYNSQIDSTIADINQNYASVKKSEQIKLMKDVINQICGTAAKYLGLSWDMIGDDKYLFGFYETNGSKNHMQILIPYDFKFSALKQKLLDWFLKKKESSEGGMDATIQTKPKKPSIKVVESFVKKTSEKKSSDIIPTDVIIPYDVAFQKSLSIIKDNLHVPSIKDGKTMLFGPLGKYNASENLDSKKLFIEFSTEKRVQEVDTNASITFGCKFYLVFHNDDTFNFYFFISHHMYPQRSIFYINDQTNTLVRQRGESTNLGRIVYKSKENCMKISAKNFNVVKLFIERFCKTAYDNVLEKVLITPYRYQPLDERLIPAFEKYIFNLYTDILKTLNIKSPLLNESFIRKTARKTQKDLTTQADDAIMTVPFQSQLIKEMCIHIWGSEESKRSGELLIKDIKGVEEFMTDENWNKIPSELKYKLNRLSISEPFNEFRYFTGIKKITHSTFQNLLSNVISEITLPKSVKEIDSYCFYLKDIKKVTLNEGLEKIGKGAFATTRNLESITLPSTVKYIEDESFRNSGISFIKLNEGLEEIGANAFKDTQNLKSVTIPSSVRKIGGSVFKNSAVGTNVKIAEGNEHIINVDNILYSSDGTKMLDILGSPNVIFDVKIKEGVKIIGDNIFQDTKITEIDIPDSVEEIGNGAFYGVPLKKIHFGKNLKKIGTECFRECDQIIEMNIPESIESFGDKCFMHLSKWGSEESNTRILDLSNCHNIVNIGKSSFDSVGFEEIILPENPKFRSLINTFSFSKNLKKVIIPEGIKLLCQTFYCCENLEETNLPSTLEYVLKPFYSNYNLKNFEFDEIPKTWKCYYGLNKIHIKNFVVDADEEGNPKYFDDSSELDSFFGKIGNMYTNVFSTPMQDTIIDNIKFNEGIKIIPSKSFNGHHETKKILFPSSLEYIEKNAFDYLPEECEIFFKPSKRIPNIHQSAFGYIPKLTIYCDEKKYRSFKTAKKYQNIFRRVEIKLLGDYNSNTFEEGYYEQGTYDSNQFGSHNYAFKILKREFNRITTNEDEIREFRYRNFHIDNKEKCPEPIYDVKFEGYKEVPTEQLPNNISNLDIKNKLNEIKIDDKKSLKELMVNIINPTGEEMYKPKVKVIYKDSNEIVFNLSRNSLYNYRRNYLKTPIEILFILSYDGKFTESFEDTEIPRLLKQEKKKLESYERYHQREMIRIQRETEKYLEKRRKQNERENLRQQRELEKIRLKEENRKQREMRRQMKNAPSEEIQHTNEYKRFDFDSTKFLKS